MTRNEKLYEETVEKITELACDQSAFREDALINMRGLIEHIEVWIDTLENDVRRAMEEEK